MIYRPSSFRKSAIALTTVAALAGASALMTFPAAAQQAFTENQCRDALVIGNVVMSKYEISPRLATSFKNFRLSNCDSKTVFERDTDADEKAFGEFRLKLIALRTSNPKPVSLTRN